MNNGLQSVRSEATNKWLLFSPRKRKLYTGNTYNKKELAGGHDCGGCRGRNNFFSKASSFQEAGHRCRLSLLCEPTAVVSRKLFFFFFLFSHNRCLCFFFVFLSPPSPLSDFKFVNLMRAFPIVQQLLSGVLGIHKKKNKNPAAAPHAGLRGDGSLLLLRWQTTVTDEDDHSLGQRK